MYAISRVPLGTVVLPLASVQLTGPVGPVMPAPTTVANAGMTTTPIHEAVTPGSMLPASELQHQLDDAIRLHGVPAALAKYLPRAAALELMACVVLLSRLTLALQHDLAIKRADAMVLYGATEAETGLDLAAYYSSIMSLRTAIARCGFVVQGTYGFMVQAAHFETAYETASSASERRQVTNGLLNWPYAAEIALKRDPLLRGAEGEPLGAVCVAYGLDQTPTGKLILQRLSRAGEMGE